MLGIFGQYAACIARGRGHPGVAAALDLDQLVQVAVNVADGTELRSELMQLSMPGALEFATGGTVAASSRSLLAGKVAIGGKSTAYVCVGPVCSAPRTSGLPSAVTAIAVKPSAVARSAAAARRAASHEGPGRAAAVAAVAEAAKEPGMELSGRPRIGGHRARSTALGGPRVGSGPDEYTLRR